MVPVTPTMSFPDIDGEARLRELILYVASRCQNDPKFGAIKLNKILWWADFAAYGQRGRPITGVEYMRLPQGPVPRRLVPVREAMQADGDLGVAVVQTYGGYEQKRPVALRRANLDLFSAGDIAIVDHVIDALRHKTARGASSQSHGKAWEIASDRDSIPYEAVFLSDDPINRSDVARTRELARVRGWALA